MVVVIWVDTLEPINYDDQEAWRACVLEVKERLVSLRMLPCFIFYRSKAHLNH